MLMISQVIYFFLVTSNLGTIKNISLNFELNRHGANFARKFIHKKMMVKSSDTWHPKHFLESYWITPESLRLIGSVVKE